MIGLGPINGLFITLRLYIYCLRKGTLSMCLTASDEIYSSSIRECNNVPSLGLKKVTVEGQVSSNQKLYMYICTVTVNLLIKRSHVWYSTWLSHSSTPVHHLQSDLTARKITSGSYAIYLVKRFLSIWNTTHYSFSYDIIFWGSPSECRLRKLEISQHVF